LGNFWTKRYVSVWLGIFVKHSAITSNTVLSAFPFKTDFALLEKLCSKGGDGWEQERETPRESWVRLTR
jgi:hypothetical protein